MNTYYSIIYVAVNPSQGERVAIGMIMGGGITPFFKISKEKLDWASKCFEKETRVQLRQSIHALEHMFADMDRHEIFPMDCPAGNFASVGYLDRMSRYNNNILQYSAPSRINLPSTQEVFMRLFQKIVVSEPLLHEQEDEEESDIFANLTESFYPRIEGKVNLDIKLTADILPTLFLPTKLNFLGQNEVQVIGKEIDFSKPSYNLGKDLNDINALMKSFEEAEKNDGKYFLIGNEPLKSKYPKQHEMWQMIYNRKKHTEIVPLDEVERIIKYIDEHGVKPYVQSY